MARAQLAVETKKGHSSWGSLQLLAHIHSKQNTHVRSLDLFWGGFRLFSVRCKDISILREKEREKMSVCVQL